MGTYTDRYATMRQFAEHLHVSYRTVRRGVKTGRIKSIRLGPNTIRIDMTDFEGSKLPRR